MNVDLFAYIAANRDAVPDVSNDERIRLSSEFENRKMGKLNEQDGYDCKLCLNRGYFTEVNENGNLAIYDCKCMQTRATLKRFMRSGMGDMLRDYTFAKYTIDEPWQRELRDKAVSFVNDASAKWLYMGGQSGCGKTMLCTAVCAEYIRRGFTAKYMLWYRDSKQLKALVNNADEYRDKLTRYADAQVLYIDDFFKTKSGYMPTEADVKLAFEIINDRLLDRDKITVISSELTLSDLLDCDEATVSRIVDAAGDYQVAIPKDRKKNYRLKGLL